MDIFIHSPSLITKKVSVCSDQPDATRAGLEILKLGGNAADAAVATFAAVSVVQPFMCGIGGDIQCLFYRTSDKSVQAINGSGRSGKNAKLKDIQIAGITDPLDTEYSKEGLWASVPGAVAGIFSVIKEFGSGKLSMAQILGPAIKLAKEGVPIPHRTSLFWLLTHKECRNSPNCNDLLINGRPPHYGEIMKFPKLAQCLKDIASGSAETFYCGPMASRMVKEIQNASGVLTLEDFKDHFLHTVTPSDALSTDFHGYRVWEMKPNTIGIVTLVILNVLQGYDLKALGHNTAEYIHLVAEATKLSFLECWDFLCDPDCCPGTFDDLLSDKTAKKLKGIIDINKASLDKMPHRGCDTTYLAVVDEEGNGCSFFASLSSYFAGGLIPDDCGFIITDRLKCMSLDEKSSNAYGPSKYPLHTLMPGIITDPNTSDLLALFGIIGRWMQPIGQVQLLLNMIIFGMDPQISLRQPRFFLGDFHIYTNFKNTFNMLLLEEGIVEAVFDSLQTKGYECKIASGYDRELFGRGHIIARPSVFQNNNTDDCQTTWWSGVDPRTDSYPSGF